MYARTHTRINTRTRTLHVRCAHSLTHALTRTVFHHAKIDWFRCCCYWSSRHRVGTTPR
jgi:hypothetical protein